MFGTENIWTDVVEQLADRSLPYDSPEMIELYQIIKDMYDKGYLGENPLSTDAGDGRFPVFI